MGLAHSEAAACKNQTHAAASARSAASTISSAVPGAALEPASAGPLTGRPG
jgi:hypothetical protein